MSRRTHRTRLAYLLAVALGSSCSRLVECDGPPFSFDPRAPYRLILGWGSGMDGLETFDLQANGALQLVRRLVHRQSYSWEEAAAVLTPQQIAAVGELVVGHGVAGYRRLYEDPDLRDGEQWVLCLEQGGRRRVVYCNNHFPPGIREFRDALLAAVEAEQLLWSPQKDLGQREHDVHLWQVEREEPIVR